jgi:orotate phosphoribosyltransferase
MNASPILVSDTANNRQNYLTLLKRYALEHREVTLASGQKSNIYLDCRQVNMRGEAQFLVGELMYEAMLKLENTGIKFDACGGMATGAIPLACALTAAAFRRGRELPGVFVRKEAKEHGTMATVEGAKFLPPSANVLLLEDVLTTGGSSLVAINGLRSVAAVSYGLGVIDREQGAPAALKQVGVEVLALFKLSEF